MKTETKINKKMPRRICRPYIKNSVSYRCEVYPTDKSTHPTLSSGVTGSFSIPLLPILLSVVAMIGVMYLSILKKLCK
ncbi:MAG: hypothetical protein IJY27_04455 [Clostridia bacterium]|nr:hypothetical protein [Clostridia bacterium]